MLQKSPLSPIQSPRLLQNRPYEVPLFPTFFAARNRRSLPGAAAAWRAAGAAAGAALAAAGALRPQRAAEAAVAGPWGDDGRGCSVHPGWFRKMDSP